MLNRRTPLRLFALLAFTVALSAAAHAQETRTWVSGVGDDVNPCSRTAPCKTFAGAISKTATGGEIDALDPAGYGTLTTDRVILRNLSINGAGTTLGVDGVRFLDGTELTLENVSIFNYSGDGVEINQSQACR